MVKPDQPADKPRAAKGGVLICIVTLLALLCLQWLPSGSPDADGMTKEEQRIATALSCLEGAGKVHVVIHTPDSSAFTAASTPDGILILCEGARDLAVQLRLSLAVQTLLGISAEQIRIFPMEANP